MDFRSSSVKCSLAPDDDADRGSASRAVEDDVARERLSPRLLVYDSMSAGGASGGGGDVHFDRVGAMC